MTQGLLPDLHILYLLGTWKDVTHGREDLLQKEMAPHSSTLAWKILWMEEPGRLQFMWSLRVGHD